MTVLAQNLLFSKINFSLINWFLGTNNPIWLSGNHPENVNETTQIALCTKKGSDCCFYSDNGYAKNCSGFFVYKLPPTHGCSISYCAG